MLLLILSLIRDDKNELSKISSKALRLLTVKCKVRDRDYWLIFKFPSFLSIPANFVNSSFFSFFFSTNLPVELANMWINFLKYPLLENLSSWLTIYHSISENYVLWTGRCFLEKFNTTLLSRFLNWKGWYQEESFTLGFT